MYLCVSVNPFVLSFFHFPRYTSRNVAMFQRTDGVDVYIFSVYVQEYEHDERLTNNRRQAYIAYVDSGDYSV